MSLTEPRARDCFEGRAPEVLVERIVDSTGREVVLYFLL